MALLVTYGNVGEGCFFCCCDKNTMTETTYRRVYLGLRFQKDKSPSWPGIMAVRGTHVTEVRQSGKLTSSAISMKWKE